MVFIPTFQSPPLKLTLYLPQTMTVGVFQFDKFPSIAAFLQQPTRQQGYCRLEAVFYCQNLSVYQPMIGIHLHQPG